MHLIPGIVLLVTGKLLECRRCDVEFGALCKLDTFQAVVDEYIYLRGHLCVTIRTTQIEKVFNFKDLSPPATVL